VSRYNTLFDNVLLAGWLGGSEALDAASSAATDVEDELVADWR
jgi:hypothetical protein